MNSEPDRIRVAFFGYDNFGWTGGLNYLKNLFLALQLQEKQKIECHLFTSRRSDPTAVKSFKGLAYIHPIIGSDPVGWAIRGMEKLFGFPAHKAYLLRKYGIRYLSHSFVENPGKDVRKIAWIPDFQHLHLPGMFDRNEIQARNASFNKKINWADRVIVSSKDAMKDLENFSPVNAGKARVIHFVSSVEPSLYESGAEYFLSLCSKYRLPSKFFFLPNQFWPHKNHLVVCQALSILKKRGEDIRVVCSGNMTDAAVSQTAEMIRSVIRTEDIEDRMILLGLIPYTEVQLFMRYSVSVMNPSKFEGWSSAVEECKSIGKNLILSDIAVHREQDPPEALWFKPDDPVSLAEIMLEKWSISQGGPDFELEKNASLLHGERLKHFAEEYISVLKELK